MFLQTKLPFLEMMNFMFRLKYSISRVGWEGFTSVLTEKFRLSLPYSLTRIVFSHPLNFSFLQRSFKKGHTLRPWRSEGADLFPCEKEVLLRLPVFHCMSTLRIFYFVSETTSVYVFGSLRYVYQIYCASLWSVK